MAFPALRAANQPEVVAMEAGCSSSDDRDSLGIQILDSTVIASRLQLDSKIGFGTYAVVYRGLYDGQAIAAKILRPLAAQRLKNVNLFIREADVLYKLQHSHVVRMFCICKIPAGFSGLRTRLPTWAIVQEYLELGALSKLVCSQATSTEPYSHEQALKWMLGVAEALRFMHSQVPIVVHRDVKTENIFLTCVNGEIVAKLGDFGLHVELEDSKLSCLRKSTLNLSAHDSVFLDNKSFAKRSLDREGTRNSSTTEPDSTPRTASLDTNKLIPSRDIEVHRLSSIHVEIPPGVSAGLESPTSSFLSGSLNNLHVPSPRALFRELQDSLMRSHSNSALREGRTTRTSPGSFANEQCADAPRAASRLGRPGQDEPRSVRRVNSDVAKRVARLDRSRQSSRCEDAPEYGLGKQRNMSFTVFERQDTAASKKALSRSESQLCDGSSFELEAVYNLSAHRGTCLYMAPEIVKEEPYNEKADVFSYGVVLFEVFTRRLLVQGAAGDNVQAFAYRVAEGYRPKMPENMDSRIWYLVQMCWQQDPCLRPSMAQVAAYLLALIEPPIVRSIEERVAVKPGPLSRLLCCLRPTVESA